MILQGFVWTGINNSFASYKNIFKLQAGAALNLSFQHAWSTPLVESYVGPGCLSAAILILLLG